LRIISGKAKGCRLKVPAGRKTRPTADRVKEAVFSAIQFDIAGKEVLDMFAGAGGLGLEALSRGAEHAVFIDSGDEAVKALRENLEKTRLTGKAEIKKADYTPALLGCEGRAFGLIFIDPPYGAGFYEDVLDKICRYGLLEDDGIAILEKPAGLQVSYPEGFTESRRKRYGKTEIIFIAKETVKKHE